MMKLLIIYVKEIPPRKNLKNLKRVLLENMKGLKDFSSIREAENLEEFIIHEVMATDPEELKIFLALPNFKRASGAFGSDKKNNYFKEMLKQKEISDKIGYFNFEFK